MSDGKDVAYVSEVPERLFVGLKGSEGADGPDMESSPLGFSVPVGTTKAHQKRYETVRNWASWTETVKDGTTRTDAKGKVWDNFKYVKHEGKTFEIENEWLPGFEFDRVVSRYETDNKVFRVLDPRGFALEVYTDCLMRIIKGATIRNSVIEQRCKWARHSGKVFLMVEGSEEAAEWERTKSLKAEGITPGDIVAIGAGEDIKKVFLGDFYGVRIQWVNYTNSAEGIANGRDSTHRGWGSSVTNVHETIKASAVRKPWHVIADIEARDYGRTDNTYVWDRPTMKREWGKLDRAIARDPERAASRLGEVVLFNQPWNSWRVAFDPSSDFEIIFDSVEKYDAWMAEWSPNDWAKLKDEYRRRANSDGDKYYNYIVH